VETLLGDASKARQRLGRQPQASFGELVREMVLADLGHSRLAVAAEAGTARARESLDCTSNI